MVQVLVKFHSQSLDDETSLKGRHEHEENLGNETFDSLFNASTDNRDRTLSEIEFENEVNEFAQGFRYVCQIMGHKGFHNSCIVNFITVTSVPLFLTDEGSRVEKG